VPIYALEESQVTKKRKVQKSKSNFKAVMIIFSVSEGLLTVTGGLKVRPLTRTTIRRF
jgi:hypothetical protein